MKWISLPNGDIVAGLNRLNTAALYEEIFVHDIYGKTGVEIADGDVVIDVGANIGLFSMWARRRAKRCRLCCFEPVPEVFDALQCNVTAHYADQVAVSDRAGKATFTYYPRLPELSTAFPELYAPAEKREWTGYLNRRIQANPIGKWLPAFLRSWVAERIRRYLFKPKVIEVATTTLANILDRTGATSLVKIDVEKSELRVLAGIGEHWDKIKQIIVECYDGPGQVDNVARILRAHDFTVSRFDNTMFPELRTPLIVGRRAA